MSISLCVCSISAHRVDEGRERAALFAKPPPERLWMERTMETLGSRHFSLASLFREKEERKETEKN